MSNKQAPVPTATTEEDLTSHKYYFETPRLVLRKKSQDSFNLYSYFHSPEMGLLDPGSKVLVLLGFSFHHYNPDSVTALAEVKPGDMFQVTIDTKAPSWDDWKPTKEFMLGGDYEQPFRVVHVVDDKMGYFIYILEEAF